MSLSLSETAVLIENALADHDVRAMRKINDRCIEETAIKFEQPTYLFALISYILSKIISKPRYFKQKKQHDVLSTLTLSLRLCEQQAKNADYSGLIATQNKIIASIEKMDDEDKRFVKSLIMKGKLKIASTLYAQGISLGNAAEMTGTDKREVLLYAGQTMMFDRLHEKKTMSERMKELREIFS